MNWREMKAGRELDILIDQKRGASIKGPLWSPEDKAAGYYYVTHEGLARPILFDSEAKARELAPKYSTELSAAFDLTIPEPYWGYNLFMEGDYTTHTCELFVTNGEGDPTNVVAGSADTPEMAICRAWLAWKEAQKDDHDLR